MSLTASTKTHKPTPKHPISLESSFTDWQQPLPKKNAQPVTAGTTCGSLGNMEKIPRKSKNGNRSFALITRFKFAPCLEREYLTAARRNVELFIADYKFFTVNQAHRGHRDAADSMVINDSSRDDSFCGGTPNGRLRMVAIRTEPATRRRIMVGGTRTFGFYCCRCATT